MKDCLQKPPQAQKEKPLITYKIKVAIPSYGDVLIKAAEYCIYPNRVLEFWQGSDYSNRKIVQYFNADTWVTVCEND